MPTAWAAAISRPTRKRKSSTSCPHSTRSRREPTGATARWSSFCARGPTRASTKQPWSYAFGRDSLLDPFVALDGKILLLGCDHDNVTFLHYVEHIADFPNKRVARFKIPVIENGARVWREMEEFDSASGAQANWPEGFFSTLVDGFLAESRNRGGSVGDARAYLLSARALLSYARPIMAHCQGLHGGKVLTM